MAEAINVFVSYSWDVERKTGIVDELEKLCQYRNIRLLRDNNVIKHGELIQQFMDKLTGGEHVITVFSKPYFQSPWCMYELLKTWQKGDFHLRTHPIIADDCDLQNAAYRIDVVDYWVAEHQKIEALLQGRNAALFVKEYEKANMLRDISQNASELMNFAAGRLTTALVELKAQNYAQLLDCIQPIKPSDVQVELLSDADFLAEVRQNIDVDLKKSDVFKEHIIQNCGIDFGESQQLHEYLLEQCMAGEFVAVIQNIQSAFVDCFDFLTEDGDVGALRKLHQAAEGSISKLVLFNVKNDWMEQYREECSKRSHHDHVLPQMSFSGVEVVSSREARTIPKFHRDKHGLDLQGGKGVALETGFRAKDVVRDVIKRLYTKVMERELTTVLDENKAVSILQKTIQQRKQQKNLKLRKNYFLLLPDEANSALADKMVQDRLKTLLPDLSFIRLKSDCHEATFIVEDEDLMVAIGEFFTTLEEYNPK
ncbi:MAG: hypothetical protein BWK73_37685 [Thiothrix lacustris]|uniref:TIR domain-containing protein n=1 Tax=Thiothrix lacustris TaxID=525917 RepID=A0A1Y1QFC6_9GAMM|nr:MAG: hypothetical protein BWK73_37685 [Thiothrix lacustris]